MTYLPREVKDEILVFVWCQTLSQPVQVLFQVFHAVDEAAIGTQLQVSHHITHCDQVRDVHITPGCEIINKKIKPKNLKVCWKKIKFQYIIRLLSV